jgi:hypothetical protein
MDFSSTTLANKILNGVQDKNSKQASNRDVLLEL